MAQTNPFAKTNWSTLGLFMIASALTVAVGSVGLAMSGASPSIAVRNIAAWLVGLALAGAIVAAGRTPGLSKGAIALTAAALGLTFFAPAQSGIHRWIDVGPLHINIAALVLPSAIVALATLPLSATALLATSGLIGLLLVAQPDASQASAFLAGALFILLRRTEPLGVKIAGAFGFVVLVAAAWFRPDPLQPIAEVEGIFALLAGASSALAAAAAIGLAITSLVPVLGAPKRLQSPAPGAGGLAIYFIVAAIMPLIGAYPVPLVGLGMSFPVGYWAGMALLCARSTGMRRDQENMILSGKWRRADG